MLRTVSLALLFAASAGAVSAQSFGSERFAVGVNAGTTGFGVEGQFRATDMINIRVGGDFFNYEEDFSTDDVDYTGDIDFKTASAFVDLHPFNNALFVSGGAYAGERTVGFDATSSTSAEIGNVVFTAAQIGTLEGQADFGDFAPFVGIGFNNTFRTSGPIGFKAVIGAAFGEEPTVTLRRSGGIPLPTAIQTQFDAELRNEERELEEDASDLKTFPVVQVGLSYRF